jgi:hypothetical protein
MEKRGITQEDIAAVIARPIGSPEPGTSLGTIVVEGMASGGRRLKVVMSATADVVVSVFWNEESG